MTLSKHVNAEKLETELLKKAQKTPLGDHDQFLSEYSANRPIPKHELPLKPSDKELVYDLMTEELTLDGNPSLNLASFVNTSVDDTASRLIHDNIVKNLADNDEYPSLIEYQERCISIISDLWHAPKKENGTVNTVGTATTGSSEAIMLAGLALKKRWQEKRRAEGKSTENPNILMASVAQVALEKFARYFDVEQRTIPVTEETLHLIDYREIEKNIDENTIGIFVILGSTFTGGFEPVEKINHLLDDIHKRKGYDISIHVDGASGGFVAPFVYPNLKWDFQVPRVVSINTSGHKFGLTTAGLGWVIWKDIEYLPESLRFKLDYLGGVEETFGLNFSRPGFPVLHQYYNFLTLGREGYSRIFNSAIQNARLLSEFLEKSEWFEVLSLIHKPLTEQESKEIFTVQGVQIPELKEVSEANQKYHPGLPVVSFRFSQKFRDTYPSIPQSMVSLLLRNKGFIIPNYHLTPNEQDKEILRVVVRDSMKLNLLDKLLQDIVETVELLIKSHDTVVNVVEKKEITSDAERKKVIYSLLGSLASGGVLDLKELQTKHLDKEGTGHHKHKRSYRGPC